MIALVLSLGLRLETPRLQPHTLERLFGAEQFATVPNFLGADLVSALASDVHSLRSRLTPAAAAHGSVEWLSLLPAEPNRRDSDCALGLQGRECLLSLVQGLQQDIEARAGFALDAACELKYAYYPCGGHYQRHIDGVQWEHGKVAREFSFLLYLNEDWSPSDGGHLRVFDVGGGGGHLDVAPAAGTLVVFKSDVVPHEVRPTCARRLAIVGWFHRHVEPPPAVDEAALTPLARALRQHYRDQGQAIKLQTASDARCDPGELAPRIST